MKQEVSWLDLPKIGDPSKGYLTAAEPAFRGLPFEIKRAVWLYGLEPGMVRGRHANRRCHQVFFCLAGELDIEADLGIYPSQYPDVYHLDAGLSGTLNRGLYMSPLVWRTLTKFTPGTVVLILSSEPYDEKDYIRDYEEFLKEVEAWKVHAK